MANDYRQATTWPPLPLTDRHRLVLRAMRCDDEAEIRALGLDGEALDFALRAVADDDGGLQGVDWHEEDGVTAFTVPEFADLDGLADFLQLVLLDLPEGDFPYATIEYANTCSRMRPGHFGGGAAFVTRAGIRWVSTAAWLDEQARALRGAEGVPTIGGGAFAAPGFVTAVAAELGPCIQEMIARIIDGVTAQAPDVHSPADSEGEPNDDGEPTWQVGLYRDGRPEYVNLTFTVTREDAREGDGPGVGLLLDAVREGGEVLASWAPHNYTDRVWVRPDDPEPLAELRRRLGVDNGGLEELADGFTGRILEALQAKETT